MKALALILAFIIIGMLGSSIGGSVSASKSVETVANNCEKLGGFSFRKKVFTCERAKKEKAN